MINKSMLIATISRFISSCKAFHSFYKSAATFDNSGYRLEYIEEVDREE